MPNEYTKFVEDVRKIYDLYGYRITWNPMTPIGSNNYNWAFIFLSILVTIICAVLANRIYKNYDPLPKNGTPNICIDLGGWLIFIAIGLCLSVVIQLYHFFTQNYFDMGQLASLSSPEHPYYSPFWGLLYTIDILFSIPLIALNCLVVALLFNKRSSFPFFYILLLASNLVFSFYQFLVGIQFNFVEGNVEFYRDLTRAFVGAAIWIPYTLYAQRVKKTFTIMQKAPVTNIPESTYQSPPFEPNELERVIVESKEDLKL